MPDRLSRPSLVRTLTILLAFVAAGAVAGWIWERVWSPPMGVVYRGEWFINPPGPDVAFSGTALYVVIAALGGLVLGVAVAWSGGHELRTLATVVVGSALAGWVMYAVGHALGPPDPTVLATDMEDYEELVSDLVLATRDPDGWFGVTAAVAFPVGALTGLAVVYLSGFGAGRRPRGRRRRNRGKHDSQGPSVGRLTDSVAPSDTGQ